MTRSLSVDPPWDQRFARLLAGALARTAVSPNTVTSVSLIIGIVAAGLFALGGSLADWGGLCFLFAFFIDHIDGELARATNSTSVFGHYFDIVAGGIVLASVFVGIGIGLSTGPLGDLSIFLGAISGLAIAIIFSVRLDLEQRAGSEATRQPNFLGFEIEDVMYLLAPVAWLGLLGPFLVLASVGAPVFLVWQLVMSRRHRVRDTQL